MSLFNRVVTSESGVQLNPVVDRSSGRGSTASDLSAAIIGVFSRGITEKPFWVYKHDWKRRIGRGGSLRASPLNEVYLHVNDFFLAGGQALLVQRLDWVDPGLEHGTTTNNYILVMPEEAGPEPAEDFKPNIDITTSETPENGDLPTPALVFKLKDGILEGFKVSVHFDAYPDADFTPGSVRAVIKILDKSTNEELYAIEGGVHPDSKDEFNQTRYIGDIATLLYDGIFEFTETEYNEWAYLANTANATVNPAGKPIFATTTVTPWITSDGPFQSAEVEAAKNKLLNTTERFGHIMGGGTTSADILGAMNEIVFERNIVGAADRPGGMTPAEGRAWQEALSVDTHLLAFYWTPILAKDPISGGMALWGSSGRQIGLRCARNARVNQYGFAPKNFPVAGVGARLGRQMMRQIYDMQPPDKRNLAESFCNPVIFEDYAQEGNQCVFFDSLTAKNTQDSYLKLISVAEMSSTIDNTTAAQAKANLQLPMAEAIKRTEEFLENYLTDAQKSGWLVPTDELNGAAFAFSVTRSEAAPADQMIIAYDLCYDGVNRKTTITQTIRRG